MLWIYGLLLLLDQVWTHDPHLGPGPGPGPGLVFVTPEQAQQVLVRRRRANWFLEEQLRSGNMERECVEEVCSYEEAREIFQNTELTDQFWTKYVDGDSCQSGPCLNQGSCRDGIGGFSCDCQTGFEGPLCDSVTLVLCENQNGGCEHFCDAESGDVRCSCADGYSLASDLRSCHSTDPFKCGVIRDRRRGLITRGLTSNLTLDQDLNQTWVNLTHLDPDGPNNETGLVQTRIFDGYDCPPGECPWQALLVNENRTGFCGGTILSDSIILTAAHCMDQSRHFSVVLGEPYMRAEHQVETVMVHARFRPETHHNDIALIKLTTPIRFNSHALPACLPTQNLAEKVLMREPVGLVSGFGHLGEFSRPSSVPRRLAVPYVDRRRCLESARSVVSTRMFCAGYRVRGGDSCQGDRGGPHVTRYGDTHFVTGVTLWDEACDGTGHFGVYTQVSKYISWIREVIRVLTSQSPDQNQDQPKRKRSSGARPAQGLGLDQDPVRTSEELRPRGLGV